MSKLVECPQCLGAKEIMIPKETKGFEYKKCSGRPKCGDPDTPAAPSGWVEYERLGGARADLGGSAGGFHFDRVADTGRR